ncbi:hypothetical protein ACIRG5_26190 [Lentzea sp. NPDC102401]|uniref:hypothetical protein n=1 Tax=Lentzea sp. NPDC102401 TaxID=3364128 RepID=UPI0037FE7E38
MTRAPAADVELVLDLRGMRQVPGTSEEFGALWNQIEPALSGRDLRTRPVHNLDGPNGTVQIEVVRVADHQGVVSAATRFSIVAVREPAQLRYRCAQCASEGLTRYGPFLCSSRTDGVEHRACDAHVSILDGALAATCAEHRPGCSECGLPATFRCAGKACHRDRAWCDRHRRPHPRDQDVAYCPSCLAEEFPRCEAGGCAAIGTVTCEHMTSVTDRCGRKICTRHALRWQVFGGERMGLGRCSQHGDLTRLSPEQVLFQIILGATARRRRERLPSLQGFGHALRHAKRPKEAVDYPLIHSMLGNIATTLGRGGRTPASDAMADMQKLWREQRVNTAAAKEQGELLVEKLKQIVLRDDRKFGAAIAGAISLGEFKPSILRNGIPTPVLFINLPDNLRGPFIGTSGVRKQKYAEQLGVEIDFEGGRRRR